MTQIPIFGEPGPPADKPAGDQVVRLRLLVTVKAAPNPSEKYGETVCVAGLSTDPDRPGWIRLYPINFRELGPNAQFRKYDVVSVDAVPARQDARKESWRPQMPSLRVESHLDGWARRRPWLDPAISPGVTMCRLHRGATMRSQSLALIRVKRVTRLRVERHPGWSAAHQAKLDDHAAQFDLLNEQDRVPLQAPRFTGTYHYHCEEPGCRGHKQGLLDWEFVAFQILRLSAMTDAVAVQHLEQRFWREMCGPDREVGFYVGNIAAHPRTFSVLGVYYPPPRRSRPR